MKEEIMLIQNEDGKFEEFEPYAEIYCNTKEDSDSAW